MADAAREHGENNLSEEADQSSRRREWRLFLFLTVVLAPALAIAVVGGFGFLVWMLQLIVGPPGPPPA